MEENVRLRGYRAADLDSLCRLDESCFELAFRFDRESMSRFVGFRRAIVVLAEAGDDLRGFVIVHAEGSGKALGGYVVTLDVAEASRRTGVAQRLMEEATQQARAAGALWMGLHVFAENKAAIAFYERCGYLRGEVIPGFYGTNESGGAMDALVYRKWIGS